MFLDKAGGDVCDYASLELVDSGSKGDRSVVVEEGGIALLVDKGGANVGPVRRGVSIKGHALE